MLLLQDEKDT